MRSARIAGVALSGLLLGLAGCASHQARYVYQDRESGVIAIAQNTPRHMETAKKLMNEHFPGENYEIVRTVEVDTGGTRATYASEGDTLDAGAGPHLTGKFFSGASLKRTHDRREAESLKLAECRIVYRKRNPIGPTKLTFAETPEFSPRVYADQVTEALLSDRSKAVEVAKAAPPKKDARVAPTAGEIEPPSFPKLGDKR